MYTRLYKAGNCQTNRPKLLQGHLKEMFHVVYTPTEGDAIQNYSRLFRRPIGCYLNINDQDRVADDLAQWGEPDDIDYIVVTGEQYPIQAEKRRVGNKLQTERRSWESVTKALEAS